MGTLIESTITLSGNTVWLTKIWYIAGALLGIVGNQLVARYKLRVGRRINSAAGSVPGVMHAHARARWTGRTLRVEIEGWVDPDVTARDADALGRRVADEISEQIPEAGAFTWTTRAITP